MHTSAKQIYFRIVENNANPGQRFDALGSRSTQLK
jgi:hypothetical protein